MSAGSVNFDRAADFYDQTRLSAPETLARVVSLLHRELEGRGPSLEIGVGTGRMALPLWERGVRMVGVDISSRMVARLVEKAGGRVPFPLALGDATALPFRADAFGAALASHVFHLIPDWREAVAELVRVVRPGGTVLVELTGSWSEMYADVRGRLAEAGGLDRLHLGVSRSEELDDAFRRAGTTLRELPCVEERDEVVLEELIRAFETGRFSYAWRVDDDLRPRAAREVREWARRRYGPLDETHPFTRVITWRAYDLPS
jgi:SAM-dependent methyltransferase